MFGILSMYSTFIKTLLIQKHYTTTITAAAARNTFAVKPQGQAARGMAYKLKSQSGAKKRYASQLRLCQWY